MQGMDVDEDIYEFLPSMLRKYMIYHGRIYTNAKHFTDFIVTGGNDPVLYEIKGKQILSSLHLNTTIFKDIILPNTMPSNDTLNPLNLTFNAYYSYKKREKEQFLFLRIHNGLVILERVDKQLAICRQFENIIEYEITDPNCTGEASVNIVYINGPADQFELSTLGYLKKGIDMRLMSESGQQFESITRELEDRVSKASSDLAELNINIQKELEEHREHCQSIDQNSNDNINILSRYGDFWIRNVNGYVLIGIPIYNSSTNKNLVEKIRVSVFASHRTQLVYTQKLYKFETENASIEPLNVQEICEPTDNSQNDGKQTDLVFSNEWAHQKQHLLYPDNAAVIIIKMELRDIEMHPSGCDYEIFAIYNVFMETGSWKELQTHLATVRIDSDIFHDQRFLINFESDRIFRDLLAIVATSERQMFRIKFADDVLMLQLHDFLLRRLSFDNIPTTLNINDNLPFTLSQIVNSTATINYEEDHQMFYCSQDGYWNGTLIRIRNDKQSENGNSDQAYEMKVYNKDEIKMKNLVATFGNEFGRKIEIEPIRGGNRTLLGLELRHRFHEECTALDDLARNIKFKTNNVQELYLKFLTAQYRTDTIWSELINDKSE